MTTISQAQTQAQAQAQAQAQQAAGLAAQDAARADLQARAQEIQVQDLALGNRALAQSTLQTQLNMESQRRAREQKFTFAAFVIFVVAAVVVLRPVARAFARRMDGAKPAPDSLETRETLQRMEHAIDAMAIEIERISEGQRFTAKLMSEREPLKAPVSRSPTP